MDSAGRLGLKPGEVLEMTLREFAGFARGRAKAIVEDWQRALFGAWHGAAYGRARRLPGLAEQMRRIEEPEAVAAEGARAVFARFAAALGVAPGKAKEH